MKYGTRRYVIHSEWIKNSGGLHREKGGNNYMKGMKKLSALLLAVMLCAGIINIPVLAATTAQIMITNPP